LEKVLQMQPELISSYSLIVEEGTPFYELDQQGFLNLPDEEDERLMYERTKEILEYYGYYRYEISNYAKPGFQCQHNIGYWTRREYLGLGIGAASLIDETRFTNIKDRGLYTEILEKEEICLEDLHENVEVIDRSGQMSEYMILGLRMMDGVSEDEFRELFEVSMESVYGPTIRKFCQMGLMEEQDGWINLTDSGVSVSNQILVEFM
jgi:oxygen-independent coproporphyrinogen-3 oxidase